MKVVNLPAPTKKGSTSRFTKSKPTKKGADVLEVCFEIVPYEGGFPPIANIVLKSTPLLSRTRSTRRFAVTKSRPLMSRQPLDTLPSSMTRASKRKTSPPALSIATKRRICYL